MKKLDYFSLIFLIVFLGVVFKNWIVSPQIIGGDWPYLYQESVDLFAFPLPAWSSLHGNGLGGTILLYSLDSYLAFTGWFFSAVLHIPWPIVYKIFWFGLFLFLGGYSLWWLLKKLFPQLSVVYRTIGVIIYLTNTYILMVMSGGQLGFGIGYACAPLVLGSFIVLIDSLLVKKTDNKVLLRNSFIAGGALAMQFLFDFRIVYMMIGAILLYSLLQLPYVLRNKRNLVSSLLFVCLIPGSIVILLNAFWVFPLLFIAQTAVAQLGAAYTGTNAVSFFSFAEFENALGLLHPNWPENIFGKVGFMKPEFLLLPLIAFSSLLFIKGKKNILVIYFCLLLLLASFLAKGANDLFGGLYLWLFETIPGFVIFRDPTKWYVLIAVSFAVLIPFSLAEIVKLKSLKKYNTIFIGAFFAFWLFLIHPAILGQLGGTLKQWEVPQEYISLKEKLLSDNNFYRTLWVPRQHRFTFASEKHPSMEAEYLFVATDSATLAKKLQSSTTEKYLSESGIKYVIIPYDPYANIFLDDRKYSPKKRDEYEKVLDAVPWLKKVQDGKITLYETNTYKDLFTFKDDNAEIQYRYHSPTDYSLKLKNRQSETLIFSQTYSPYWKLFLDGREIQSKNDQGMNSFVLPATQDVHEAKLQNSLTQYYLIGQIISLITVLILSYLLLTKRVTKSH